MKKSAFIFIAALVFAAAGCGGESAEEEAEATGEMSGTPEDVAVTEEEMPSEDAAGDFAGASDMAERPMEQVRAELASLSDIVRVSYEELLETDPEAAGTIEVSFGITPEGSVVDIEVSADPSLESLYPELEYAVMAMEFVPLAGRSDTLPVTVPIELTPPEAAPEAASE